MKIDLSIMDATPEEVAHILLAVSSHITGPLKVTKVAPADKPTDGLQAGSEKTNGSVGAES